MSRRFAVLLLCATAWVALSIQSASAAEESWTITQLTNNSNYCQKPQISGNRVAWWENVGGTQLTTWKAGDTTNTAVAITDASRPPGIYGERLAWMKFSDSSVVQTWELGSGITTVTAADNPAFGGVSVWGKYVAWADTDPGFYNSVFAWWPTASAPVKISTSTRPKYEPVLSGTDRLAWSEDDGTARQVMTAVWGEAPEQLTTTTRPGTGSPKISGERVVWFEQTSDTGGHLFTWTPASGVTTIGPCTNAANYAVSGDRVVYNPQVDAPDGDGTIPQIMTWTPASGLTTITTDAGNHQRPDVWGDRMVWLSGSAVMTMRAGESQATTLATSAGSNDNPHVWANRVVWEGVDGQGHRQIYMAAPIPPTGAPGYVGTVTRASLGNNAAQADLWQPLNTSVSLAATRDGRYVMWHTNATTLVSGDANGMCDVFVRDRLTGETKLASLSSTGAQGSTHSYAGSITGDGRLVFFQSAADDFVPGDSNNKTDLFIRDLQSATTTLALTGVGGAATNGDSYAPRATPDGRYMVFQSTATNLVDSDTNGVRDWFVRDRVAGTNQLVNVDSDEVQSTSTVSHWACISDNGRYVAFTSEAEDLVSDDTNGARDVFLRDLEAGTTTRVSVDSDEAEVPAPSGVSPYIAMSADGRYVAFATGAALDSTDVNTRDDVYIRDTQEDTTKLVSLGDSQSVGNNYATAVALSPDGGHVAFMSAATDLLPGDTEGKVDVFVRDLASKAISRASVNGAGVGGNLDAGGPLVGDDGAWVLFGSDATNLVTGDTNGIGDLFMAEAWTGTKLSLSAPTPAYGSAFKLTAHVKRANGANVLGRSVIFERWTGSGWQNIGSASTGTTGRASLNASGITTKTTYRARFVESAPYRASSAALAVLPQVKLSRSTSWSRLARSRTYYAKGFIQPKHSKGDSNKVRILAYKKRSDGSWRYVKSFKASYSYYSSTKSRYRAAVKLTSKGTWKLVAYHAADSRNAKTYGSPDYVKVR